MNKTASIKGPDIEVKNLSLRLGNSLILEDMSFTVAAASIHCLIGPNGGGKTSTLKCILGQMPHKGDIRLDWREGESIGYVPQLLEMERTLPLTIDNFLSIIAQDKPAFIGIKKEAKERIDKVLEKVDLTDKRHFMIGSLSGGERQRLLFAQALLPSPDLLVLDEPMTSLDEGGHRLFEDLILELQKQGVTILWINHDLSQVRRLANAITVIDKGVLASGPTESTLTDEMEKGVFKANVGAANV